MNKGKNTKNNNTKNNANNNSNEVLEFYDAWDVEKLPEYIKILMKFEETLVIQSIANLEEYKKVVNKKNALVLDCGCGFGSFYNLTSNLDAIYLDFSLNLLKKFENIHGLKTNKICGNVLNLPFKDNSFDMVLCINVLEHIVDYKQVLYELKRILKNNGVLIVVVVNSKSIINEEIFNDFKIYHKPLNLEEIKIDGFTLQHTLSVYFVPSFFKIFPPLILKKILKKYIWIDFKLGKIFDRKGQFLVVVMKKSNNV
jgi:ubiquinone/menaquinone biosynthesis C-methylase UbiE